MTKLLPTAALPFFLLLCFFPGEKAPAEVRAAAPAEDARLQSSLDRALRTLPLERALREKRLAVSVIDLSDPSRPRYAGLNDREMMYAASLPKITILLAGFERIREGTLRYTQRVREMFTRMTRFSSNRDASEAVRMVGFEYIAKTLTSPRYRLYDPEENGGLWLGKAYGGPNGRWKRDPLHNISHGATSYQVARFFWLLDRGELVSPRYSSEMKKILSNPGIRHKFVAGLASKPGRRIYRKSGTWRGWHADGALVEADGRKYVAVALMEDSGGGAILPRIIQQIDELICGPEDGELTFRARLD